MVLIKCSNLLKIIHDHYKINKIKYIFSLCYNNLYRGIDEILSFKFYFLTKDIKF